MLALIREVKEVNEACEVNKYLASGWKLLGINNREILTYVIGSPCQCCQEQSKHARHKHL